MKNMHIICVVIACYIAYIYAYDKLLEGTILPPNISDPILTVLLVLVLLSFRREQFRLKLTIHLVLHLSFGAVTLIVLLFNDPFSIATPLGKPLSTCLVSVTLARLFMGGIMEIEAAMDLSLGFICAYILYETQLIIEKKRTEDTDFLSHCLMLFVDLLYGFIELLRILLEQEEEDEEQEEEEDEEREEEEDEEQEEKENKEREEEEDEEQEEEEIEEQEEDEQLKTLCLFVQSLLA
ncbi:ran GTPase-activating protein 1-like [Artemia franciscana]|uniref:ran GTPase-activating protein 1-like n=1 Tax=Artemia franciscana TaxID=6661 RepID=UPI0032DA9E8F